MARAPGHHRRLLLALLPGIGMMLVLGDLNLLWRLGICVSMCGLGARLISRFVASAARARAIGWIAALTAMPQESVPRAASLSWLISAAILAIALPATIPSLLLAGAAAITVLIGHGVARGSGLNPAMLGFAALALLLPVAITLPPDAASGASVLDLANTTLRAHLTVSETLARARPDGQAAAQAAAWLAGGLWLIRARALRWRAPLAMLLGVALPALLWWMIDSDRFFSPLQHLISGGTVFAAFFVVSEPRALPDGVRAQWLYGLTIGILTFAFRHASAYADGIAFAVLLANLLWRPRAKPVRALGVVAVGLILFFAGRWLSTAYTQQQSARALRSTLTQLFDNPAARAQWHLKADPAYAQIEDGHNHLIGWITQGEALGYRSRIKVMRISNVHGDALSERLVEQHETPSFTPALTARARVEISDTLIDAFSGASLSRDALIGARADAAEQAQRLARIHERRQTP
ncbi:RnfABCDGE type electron transport complex subunit D [Sinimarinibacterium sp. NLF-5-8]|uniref:RnfABCDGE type electron transport complex subunit D n=1 Tax=Sinimarinibacterium sp. NLF-5-8 TaxID=2698684 RepID=UPI00137C1900|nr:RnfABCDGE type electron transport complex subunit D [Sinimarinibacterium sp. NLF-5-8]QHS09558.1 hypothetical protein GT972_04875 [Sinimarinibacterium sp. NLF-5-8]